MLKQLVQVGLHVEGLAESVERGNITRQDGDAILADAKTELKKALSCLPSSTTYDYEIWLHSPWTM